MLNNINRTGHFTSSNIHKLFGQPAKRKTYIQEVRMERKLKRPLQSETFAKPLMWGKLMEKYVFNHILGLEYSLTSDVSLKHKEIEWWSGSPDGQKEGCVLEIKCPFTMKSFCELSELTTDNFKKENPEYYWQIASNAEILGLSKGELVAFCPTFSELGSIVHLAQNMDAAELHNYYWLASANYDELPYLTEESGYQPLFRLEFEIPESDKELLRAEVIKANNELLN